MRTVLQIPYLGKDMPSPKEARLMHETWLYAISRGWQYVEIGCKQYHLCSTFMSYRRYMAHHPELAAFIRECKFAKGHRAQLISDLIRLHYASDNRDVIYVDRDASPVLLPVFEEGTVWFARYSEHTIDHFMFYADDPAFFAELLQTVMRRLPRQNGKVIVEWASIHGIVVEECLGKTNVIEPPCFIHLNRSKAA